MTKKSGKSQKKKKSPQAKEIKFVLQFANFSIVGVLVCLLCQTKMVDNLSSHSWFIIPSFLTLHVPEYNLQYQQTCILPSLIAVASQEAYFPEPRQLYLPIMSRWWTVNMINLLLGKFHLEDRRLFINCHFNFSSLSSERIEIWNEQAPKKDVGSRVSPYHISPSVTHSRRYHYIWSKPI